MERRNEAVAILKEIGLHRLCGTDGCLCMNCEFRGVTIDVACRKSSSDLSKIPGLEKFHGVAVRVFDSALNPIATSYLMEIADEVVSQLKDSCEDIAVRFCGREHDRAVQCIFCHAPRKPEDYACPSCVEKYDYRLPTPALLVTAEEQE